MLVEETLKGRKELLRVDLLPRLQYDPVREELVRARPHEPADSNFAPPRLRVEAVPLLLVEGNHVLAALLRRSEERVLDEVDRQQFGPPGVQDLEDRLRVVVGIQVDDDDLD